MLPKNANRLTLKEAKILSALDPVGHRKYPRPGWEKHVYTFADGTRAFLINRSGRLSVRYYHPIV